MAKVTDEYRVQAVNTSRETENKVHDDDAAARYGFRGGLVPGVNVYGYMAVPVLARLGRAWLASGRMAVKFLQPFYEGETVVVRVRPGQQLALTAEDESGAVRASGTAALGAPPSGELPPEAPLPQDRPEASPQVIHAGRVLGSLPSTRIEDVSPQALLGFANTIIVRNYRISPWIHTASEVAFYRAAGRASRSACAE